MRSATILALACTAILVLPAAASPKLFAGKLQLSVYGASSGFIQQFCPADFQAACEGAQFKAVVRDNGVFSGSNGATSYAARITMLADGETPGCNMSFTGKTFVDGVSNSNTYIYGGFGPYAGLPPNGPYVYSQDDRNAANHYPTGGFLDSTGVFWGGNGELTAQNLCFLGCASLSSGCTGTCTTGAGYNTFTLSPVDESGSYISNGNCKITFTAVDDFTSAPWDAGKPLMFDAAASTCVVTGSLGDKAGVASCYSGPQALLLDSHMLTLQSASITSLQISSTLSANSNSPSTEASAYECYSPISLVTPGSTLDSGSAVDTWAYAFPGINGYRYFQVDPSNGGYCGNTDDAYLSTYVNRSLGDLTYNADVGNGGGSCFGVNPSSYTTVANKITTYNATHVVRTVSSMENLINSFLGGAGCTLVYVAACYPGTYSSTGTVAAGVCTACASGSISGVGATSCTPCAIGTFTTDAQTCQDCPASTFSGAGATSCTPFASLMNMLNNITASLASLQLGWSGVSCATFSPASRSPPPSPPLSMPSMPPPSPLPPSPPRAQGGYSVTTTSRLDGVLPEHFDDTSNYTSFTNALAASVGTVPGEVDILSSSLPTRRRALQQAAGVAAHVSYIVMTATSADAQRVSADVANTTRFLAELRAAGLTDVTAVTLVVPPQIALVPAVAPVVPVINSITVTPLVTVPGGGSFLNPALEFVLVADVTSTAPDTLVYAWSQFSGPALNLSNPATVSGLLSDRVLAFFPGALAPSSVYQFSLSVTDRVGRATPVRARVATMALPYNGTLSVTPAANVSALVTPVTLVTSGWYDGNANGTCSNNCLDLQYAFAYSLGVAGVDGDLVWLSTYGNATTLDGVVLPPGNVTLQAYAKNSIGATSASPAVISLQVADTPLSTVNVTQLLNPSLAPVELSARLMTVTEMLNDAVSTNTTAADVAASVQLRTDLMTFLQSLSSPAAGSAVSPLQSYPPLVVENIAVATAALLAPTTQVSQACTAAALEVLGNVSSLSSLTPLAVNAVAEGLSSLAAVADLSLYNGGVGTLSGAVVQGLRLGVVGVVSLLSNSLLNSISTPGAAPVVVSTPGLSLYLALDDSAPGNAGSSRLFSQPITAGGQSAFAPLPPDVFAAVPSAVTGGVRTALAAFSFDPFATLMKFTVLLTGYTAVGGTEQTSVLKALAAAANRGLGVAAVQASSGAVLSNVSGASSVTLNVQLELPANASSAVTTALLGVNSADAQASGLSLATGFAVSGVTFGTPGFTRLEFSTLAGAPVAVANLSAPVTFTLPALPSLVSGVKAQCQWYDNSAQAYSTVGCVSLPDPRPAGHTVAWAANFTAASDAAMVLAWTISGPLAANCSLQVMDCTTEPPPQPVYPNPLRPFDVAQVACDMSGVNTEPKRVITGSFCALIQEDNAYGCFWDNSKQAFVGAGCVASGGPVQCACRHLTDFAGASKPSIPTASLQDLLSLNPADIVTKLKYLFIVVIVLFGCMWLGAAFGYVQDAKLRAGILRKLQQPRMGFQATEQGAWLWRFHMEPIETDLAPPTGPAVELAKVFGMPLARLRAALPDELLEHTLAETLGRRYGLSASGMEESLETQINLTRRLSSVLSRSSSTARKSQSGHTDASNHGHTPREAAKSETMPELAGCRQELELLVGTALVLAFIQVGQLMPVVEMTRRVSAAAARFEGLHTPAGWDFGKMQTDFVTLLSPGVLNGRSRWLQRARFFKLVLAQSPEGWWDATSTVAFALEARSASEVKATPPTLMERLRDRVGEVMETYEEDNRHHGSTGAAATFVLQSEIGQMQSGDAAELEEDAETPRTPFADDMPTDDPLACSAASLVASVPRRLAALQAQGPNFDASRVWTTLCCIAMLQELPVSWIWGDGDLYMSPERTIVDGAHEWLARYSAERPALQQLLADGSLRKRAKRLTRVWRRACEMRIKELRQSDAIRAQRVLSQAHRASAEVMRAVCTQHSTFAVFLAEPLDGLQRWQMFIILISVVISQLLVNIWMFYAKGANCCNDMRLILDSGPDGGACPPVGPCRGFEGNCGDIATQFATLPVLPDFPNGLQDWTCTAFPDDENKPVDSFIVGLISIAIGIPVTIFIATCFGIANDSEAPESWLEWYGYQKLIWGPGAHRRWHYTGPAGQPWRFVKWYVRSVGAPPSETAANLVRSLWAFLTCSEPAWAEEAREEEEEALSAVGDTDDGSAAEGSKSRAYRLMAEHGIPTGSSSAGTGLETTSQGSQLLSLVAGEEQDVRAADVGVDKVTLPAYSNGKGGGYGDAAQDVEIPGDDAASEHSRSTTSSIRSAIALSRYKRYVMSVGIGATLLAWAIFAWFIFTYGMLCYKLLGEESQASFAKGWGISYGLNAATEWRDIVQEAAKGMLILVLLETLMVTRNSSWLEDHVDYLSLQALMFGRVSSSLFGQAKLVFIRSRRLS